MGSCLSKKSVCASSSSSPKKEAVVKKEIFVIKHRISHEIERPRSDDETGDLKNVEGKIGEGLDVGNGGGGGGGGGAAPVRTSSCTKEEVDAILIQCGRLSRSSSTGKAGHLSSENGGRKYSGSKRSYDFDNDNGRSDGNNVGEGDDDAVARERENRRRERHRQSQGRRRTPSREREKDQAAQQQRSGSRERVAGGGGRRVSRSPGRRSESPITANSNSSSANTNSRPGKMVSVPATVSSMAMDKSTNAGEPNSGAAIKRIQVKRNVGGDGAAVGTTRTASSPRARSPANVRAPPIQKTNGDKHIVQGAENRINQQQHLVTEETKGQYGISGHVGLNVISSVGPGDNPKLNAVARTRSSRLSRELDINPETLSNPNAPPSSSYTALLLEDIQNFHQKNTTPSPPPPSFSLPECLTKACSILEAVADLNSSTGENKPGLAVRKTVKTDPTIVESEVVVNDDLMEPSFHKYVTVKRGGTIGVGEDDEDFEEQESSGSNSVVVGSQQQQWLSSSGWEPNSAESTDRWTCSSSASASSSGKRVVSAKKRNSQHSGIGRGRIGTGGVTLQDNVVFRV
ncbi:hypothetical protein MIMGU_mgv1a003662mg [Erythranthe guttata]|uniref:Uncharacterized protein n=1 Tax=Erythranthe guttata TaxID=4155 RepID=A0A022QAD0_ERYGU|nr:hypothetical protein MIMGU_mgv1a003662mg [Erythranthe guttata]